MAELLHEFGRMTASDGQTYDVRACGAVLDDSLWEGWIEFEPVDGGTTLHSGRETTQPNRVDTVYWASGLTEVYLEGAFTRAGENPRVAPTRG